MTTQDTRTILVADSNTLFTEALKSDPAAAHVPLKVVYTGAQAQTIIADASNKLMGIFVSLELQLPNWFSVLKCAHLNRPVTPLYIIVPEQPPAEFAEIDIKKIGAEGTVKRGQSYSDLIKLVAPVTTTFDFQGTIGKARVDEKVGTEIQAADSDFVSIRAEDFIAGSKSSFDIYVLLPTGKFIKLLQAGDNFESERLGNYLKKGVTHFFIRKEMQEAYVSYCDYLATTLLKKNSIAMELKVSQTANQGEETLKHFQSHGVSEANISYASKFVGNVRELSKQLAAQGGNALTNFMDNISGYEHGVATSMLAGILANHLKIASESPVQIIGSAALFHDIGLTRLPKELWHEDESKMTPEQIEIYRTHPTIAAESLGKIQGFNTAALQAIAQHHMRVGQNKGFPERPTSMSIHKISEIIGACDELNRLIIKHSENPSSDFFAMLERDLFPHFSRMIIDGVKQAFYPAHYVIEDVKKVS